jgi:hypothetical protein
MISPVWLRLRLIGQGGEKRTWRFDPHPLDSPDSVEAAELPASRFLAPYGVHEEPVALSDRKNEKIHDLPFPTLASRGSLARLHRPDDNA